jgi:thymidylate synthase
MKVGRFIRATTITNAWHRGLNLIWREGAEITDERGTRTRELMNLLMVVKDPYHDMIPTEYSWNEERLEEYAKQLLSGTNPGFEYTYGERLRRWGGSFDFLKEETDVRVPVDQIEAIIQRLKSTSTTRRATAVTWIPPIDTPKDEVPCMIVDDFKMRDGKLHLTALFRSHDFAGAYPANLYGLAGLLKYVANNVGTKPGSISTVSVSAHIYEHDWDWISEMLE